MHLIRSIIELSTQTLCYVKKNRRIRTVKNSPVKINLGCGLAVAKGWINVDGSLNALIAQLPAMHKLSYRVSGANRYYTCTEYCSLLKEHQFVHHDLSYGIPFENESVDFVYSSHFLEHLFKKEAAHILQEAYRVLKPGGIIRICVPDLAYAISLYANGEKEKMLDNYFFVEDRESYFARHKYMYDFDILKNMLEQTGFKEILRCSYCQGKTPDTHLLDNRPEDTLFIEAIKRFDH